MRHLFLLIIASLSIGCGGSEERDAAIKNPPKSPSDLIEEKIKIELSSGERNDTIFMGYRLGMSKKEVYDWSKKLKNENKLKTNPSTNEHYFELIFEDSESIVEATMNVFFDNDSLYQVLVYCEQTNELINSPAILFYKMYMTYMDKYGSPIELESKLKDTPIPVWIHGNREIKMMEGHNDVKVIYSDLPTLNRINKKEEDEKKALLDKTSDAI